MPSARPLLCLLATFGLVLLTGCGGDDDESGDENQAQILPGDAHAQNIFDTDQGEPATKAILERLERFSGR